MNHAPRIRRRRPPGRAQLLYLLQRLAIVEAREQRDVLRPGLVSDVLKAIQPSRPLHGPHAGAPQPHRKGHRSAFSLMAAALLLGLAGSFLPGATWLRPGALCAPSFARTPKDTASSARAPVPVSAGGVQGPTVCAARATPPR